jgi:maleate isomerase
MYGWRARIGIIVPSTNTVVESEFWRMAPRGVSIHASRLRITETTPAALKQMAQDTERAAEELATAKVDVILYACTSGSFLEGPEWEGKLKERITGASGTRALTTSGAVITALKEFGVRSVSLATPYIEEVNKLEIAFLQSHGFDVIQSAGLGIVENVRIGSQSPEASFRLGRSVATEQSEALFISCTDFRTIENIALLETDLHIPVISSNQASMWASLRSCGVAEELREYGSLFSHRDFDP